VKNDKKFFKAVELLEHAERGLIFTGAGISVESGIPPFRGPTGLWSKYDPNILEIDTFMQNPEESWPVIKEIFYDFYGQAKPNPAHYAVAALEQAGKIKTVVTQNIDHLHHEAGSKNVIEYHGTLKTLTCLKCHDHLQYEPTLLTHLPVRCAKCNGLIKPDFVFFGQNVPLDAQNQSREAAIDADVVIIVGSTGEVMPASYVPHMAKMSKAKIIEINPEETKFTKSITDIFLQGKAGEILPQLVHALGIKMNIPK